MFEKYKIGVPEMDAQHARWIQLIENFKRLFSADEESDRRQTETLSALRQLLDYTRSHFESEEKFLERHGYPKLIAHQQRHKELEQAVSRLHDTMQAGRMTLTQPKLNMLSIVWLMEHILKEDADYAKFLANLTA